MQRLQADVHSLPGERLVPLLLADTASAGAALDSRGRLARAALAAWDFECPSGLANHDPAGPASDDRAVRASAAGCAAYHVVHARLRALTFGDDLAAAPMAESDGVILLAFLAPDALGRTYWDDSRTPDVVETRAAIVTAALNAAGAELVSALGVTVDEWMWGRIHTVTLRADLFDAAGVTEYNSATFARDGGADIVDVGHPRDELSDDYSFDAGASVRWACEASAAGVGCTAELPGGQSHHPSSPSYDALLPAWLDNRPTPMLFDLAAARAAAVETIAVVPGETR
jgi:penicillin amidase